MVTIHDVARHAGVSATTAKRAIRAPHLLAPDTLLRVKRSVDELRYEPNHTAGALRRGRSDTIGLMVGNIVEPFFAHLTRVVAREVRSRGYALLVADNEYRSDIELQHLKIFVGQRAAGIILRSGFGTPNLDYLEQMAARGTAIVQVDYFFPDSPFGHVMLANTQAVREGVTYLHGLGHRRIAALATYDAIQTPEERSQAFPEALAAVGLSVPDDYRGVVSLADDEAVYRLTTRLMGLAQPPTALFALTGNQGMSAYRALRDIGLRVPTDVSLLTFDNYAWTSLVDPQVDVIEQPVEEMGLAAVEAVIKGIEHGGPVRKRFPGRLIRRGSCAPPKPGR